MWVLDELVLSGSCPSALMGLSEGFCTGVIMTFTRLSKHNDANGEELSISPELAGI